MTCFLTRIPMVPIPSTISLRLSLFAEESMAPDRPHVDLMILITWIYNTFTHFYASQILSSLAPLWVLGR